VSNHYVIRYPEVKLALLRHYLIGGTWTHFYNDSICTYFPPEDGVTLKFLAGSGSEYGNVYGPGSYLDLQLMSSGGPLQNKRQALILESGYTICLVSKLPNRIQTKIIEAENFELPAHTKAIVLSGPMAFTDSNSDKVAHQFNLILDRPYNLKLSGHGKLMLINIHG